MAVLSIFANPHRFMAISKPFAWGFTILGAALILWGVYQGLYTAPSDYRQGDAARIMYIHVGSMWLSMFAYAFMVGASFVSLVWRHALADVAAKSAAPIGAAFTALGLITGSIWGKPMWGTWWEWGDARIVSVLILFFVYLAYIAIWQAMETQQKAARAAAILCLVGAINLPVIHYSVEWWNTLHQSSSFMAGASPDRPSLARAIGLDPAGSGGAVLAIDPGREPKILKDAHLEGGDVLASINGAAVTPETQAELRAVVLSGEALTVGFTRDGETTTRRFAAKLPTAFKIPMYIIALGYLSLFGGLTLLNMRAEIMLTRAEMLTQRKLATAE